MKRALIITVAGCSKRFSTSLGKDVYKILYHEGRPEESLLSEQLALVKDAGFDTIVIVGGYAFTELKKFIEAHHGSDLQIELVFNEKYIEYGTCYSFACGLKVLQDRNFDEIVLMEGDLFVDRESLWSLINCKSDVITANRKLIRADESVIFYVSNSGSLHYNYDTQHLALKVEHPVKVIGNSGQIWKFCNTSLLHEILSSLGSGLFDGTNLLPIERYFNSGILVETKFIVFNVWFNCNTIEDYRAIRHHKENFYEGNKRQT